MTAPAQTALAFAREVMGWEDAYHSGDGYIVSPSRNGSGVWEPQHSASLNAVMAAVRSWMPGKAESVSLHCFDGELFVAVVISDRPLEMRSEPLADPCQALMAACLAATRKMRAET